MVTAVTDYSVNYLEVVNDGVSLFIKKAYVISRINADDPDVVDFMWHWYENAPGKRLFLLEFARFTPVTYASAALLNTSVNVMLDSNVTLTAVQILINKAITPRVIVMADATSFTPTGDTADINTQVNTQAVGTLTGNAPSGTPMDGQKIRLFLKCTNVQTFSWNATYVGSATIPMPTTTTGAAKTDEFEFEYRFLNTKWNLTEANYGYT